MVIMTTYDSSIVPQANDFDKVLEMAVAVSQGAHSDSEIGSYFDMDPRQGSYYRAAAVSLGLITNHQNHAELTDKGQLYVASDTAVRSKIARKSLISNPFMEMVINRLRSAGSLSSDVLVSIIREETTLGGSTPNRRVSSIANWLDAVGIADWDGEALTAHANVIDSLLEDDNIDEDELHDQAKQIFKVNKPEIPDSEFDAGSVEDAREETIRRIKLRRGQPAFRRKLLSAYEKKCAITGCDVVSALEAAHITPYMGDDTNRVGNGLLLRADIHTLFDLGLLSISDEFEVLISSKLQSTVYEYLNGSNLNVPDSQSLRPSQSALAQHRQTFGYA